MNKTLFKVLVISLGLLAMGTPSQAALTAVDPGPYTAGTGFSRSGMRTRPACSLRSVCLRPLFPPIQH